jgi:molecular chaperone DnaK (HSP70)
MMYGQPQRVPVFGLGLKERYYQDGDGNFSQILKTLVKGAQGLFKKAAPAIKERGIAFMKQTGEQLKEAGKDYIKENKEEIKKELKKFGKRATKIAEQEAEEAVKEVLSGANVKETIQKRGKKAISRASRSAQSRGKRVSKAQAQKIQDILDQQKDIAQKSAQEALRETQTELGRELDKTSKKLKKELKKDVRDMGISSLFGLGMVQLGRKRNGKGLKQLGAGHCK